MSELEKTLILIKPDGVERNLIGKIIARYEEAGLKVVDMKMLTPSLDLVERHYPDSMAESLGRKAEKAGAKIDDYKEHGKKVLNWLRNYLTSGRVVAMILEGEDAIARARTVTGYTDPAAAEKGTIRGDFGEDSILQATKEGRVVRNLIHASGDKEEAEREIKLWFG